MHLKVMIKTTEIKMKIIQIQMITDKIESLETDVKTKSFVLPTKIHILFKLTLLH